LFSIENADKASRNYIGIFKLSNISEKKREPVPSSAIDGDADVDSESSSDEDDEINEDTKPILHLKKGGSCGVCKSDTLNDSKTTYMCYVGRHWSCSGVGLELRP
jgi:ribosome assembly protein RRB1